MVGQQATRLGRSPRQITSSFEAADKYLCIKSGLKIKPRKVPRLPDQLFSFLLRGWGAAAVDKGSAALAERALASWGGRTI